HTRGNAMRSSACVAGARSRAPGRFGLAFVSSALLPFALVSCAAAAAFAALSLATSPAEAASITGTVKGPDGAPVRAAFVQARHGKLKMTVSVLTDAAGRYAVENLPAGEYRLSVRLTGAKAEPKSGITLAADATASHDFALQAAPVRWSDLTILQGLQLLPQARGKQTLVDHCINCHRFPSEEAA